MRPDKKKKQHHDSRKRAEKAREGQAGHAEASVKAETNQNTAEECEQTSPSNPSESEPPKSCKDRVKKVEEKPAKNISSNWTKYEIPSEDENEEDSATTGINFNFALENAGQIQIPFFKSTTMFPYITYKIGQCTGDHNTAGI